jgi:hypothetical protein
MGQLFVGQFKRFVAMPRQWIDHASPICSDDRLADGLQ